jgi:hypothetical protein
MLRPDAARVQDCTTKHKLRFWAPDHETFIQEFDVGDGGEVTVSLNPENQRPKPVPLPSRAPAPSEASGHLTLTTRPAMTIYLDDKPAGRTPIELTLTPGRHEIKIVGRDRRTRKTLTLDVTPGQKSNLSFSFDD